MSDKKFNVYNKVRYIGNDHNDMPEFYPAVGTTGIILEQLNEYGDVYVQWEKGSTSREDRWYCDKNDVELVKDEDMTNEEIWGMLKPKMEKNGLKSVASIVRTSTDRDCSKFNLTHVYAEDDVHNAIALAYKVGYLRAMKGRPFKIGEKKKKGGHWEPVDPNNLPKEGTRVRLNKPYDNYYGGIIKAGTVGCVFHDASYSSRVNGYGVNFGEYKTIWFPLNRTIIADCLDMWVEDDE